MIVDFDDFSEVNHGIHWLFRLKEINPAFKCTLFAIPGQGRDKFWNVLPEWMELAVHGWMHPDSYECDDWSKERMEMAIRTKPARFVTGFKAPGWQISDGCYEALLEAGWWVADQPYNDVRRPIDLPVHRLGDGDHWHGHIQDVCGNGLRETFPELSERVAEAESFEFVSEVTGVLATT